MVIMEDVGKLVKLADLLETERRDLKRYFEAHDEKKIIELEAGRYCTYKQITEGREPADIRVTYSPDMFFLAQPAIAVFGYAIADDENGNHAALLTNKLCTYVHRYKYAGGWI